MKYDLYQGYRKSDLNWNADLNVIFSRCFENRKIFGVVLKFNGEITIFLLTSSKYLFVSPKYNLHVPTKYLYNPLQIVLYEVVKIEYIWKILLIFKCNLNLARRFVLKLDETSF